MVSIKMDLQLTPSPSDCLAWSEDGILAIAALEDIHVLVSLWEIFFFGPAANGPKIPKRPHSIVDAATPKWERIKFRANDFSSKEFSFVKTPLAKDMMIGDQQNVATVTAIAWSSPGLARHSRSALAVLTTNHVLSIWASSYNVEESNSWKRVLVINGASSRFGRVRSMKWASSCPVKLEDGRSPAGLSINILAVGLDGGKVVFLDIRGSSSTETSSWRYRTLDEIDLDSEFASRSRQDCDEIAPAVRSNRFSLFGNAMKTLRFVESINFSAWANIRNDYVTTASFCGNDGSRWMCDFRMSDDLSEWDCNLLGCLHQPNDEVLSDPQLLSQTAAGSRIMGTARLGPILAICVTNPPHHEITYRGPTEDTCTIVFDFGEGPHAFPWQEPAKLETEALKTILSTVTEPGYLETVAINSVSLKILYAEFMAFLLNYDMKEHASYARAQRLLAIMERFSGNLQDERELLSQLANNNNLDDDAPADKCKRTMEITWKRGEHQRSTPTGESRSHSLIDDCPICSTPTPLAYKNIWQANCRAGHQIDRCKLTLLPIINPTSQKTCADCEMQFIDEYKHPEMRTASTTNRDQFIGNENTDPTGDEVQTPTGETRQTFLANRLFFEFDRCPYCKGNFTSQADC